MPTLSTNPRQAARDGTEIWAPTHHPGYEVSNLGNVRSGKGLLNPTRGSNGYRRVSFWDKDLKRMLSYQVHALVLTAFDGPKAVGQITRHLNGVPGEDSLDNLAWGSHAGNHADSLVHGTHSPPPVLVQVGEINHSAKLSLNQVVYIRSCKRPAKTLALELGVTQWTIFDIRKGRSWTHLSA